MALPGAGLEGLQVAVGEDGGGEDGQVPVQLPPPVHQNHLWPRCKQRLWIWIA